MRENDRYDEIHEEMASGEGMPEARQPHAPEQASALASDDPAPS